MKSKGGGIFFFYEEFSASIIHLQRRIMDVDNSSQKKNLLCIATQKPIQSCHGAIRRRICEL